MPDLIYNQSDLPPFDSEYMQRFAQHLWQIKLYWHDARRPLEAKWRECDEAYLCYRWLPDTGGMEWVDNSDFGETDIFDNVNLLSMRMALALMPRNESWLTVSSREDEAQSLIQAIQDQQVFMHRKAGTRRQYARHIKQAIIRGNSALWWTWRNNTRYRRLSEPESNRRIREHMDTIGADRKDVNKAIRARYPETTFSGPHIRPIDIFDVWIDPHLDLTNTPYAATITQTFHFLPDLKAAVDDNQQPNYKNLEGIIPFSVEQIYGWDNNLRIRTPEVIGVYPLFGSFPARITGFTQLVPVYVMHFPYIEFEGEEFFDTYFYVAVSAGFRYPRIIKVEENPSDTGRPHIFVDSYIDWFTNIPYGIGGVEKALTYYRQKNILQAVTINAAVASQFPALMVWSDAFRDDAEVSFAPGALNEIGHNNLGLEVMKPVPTPDRGLELGMQDLRWYAQDIRTKMGVDGLTVENPNRSLSKSKTATEVNSDTTSGSMFLDDMTEKFSWTLNEICQWGYEISGEKLVPDAEGNLEFERVLADRIMQSKVPQQALQIKRTIQVNGTMGLLNRQQEMQNLQLALQVSEAVAKVLPNAPQLIQKVYLKVMQRLNVPIDPQDMLSPQQIAAANPQVQMEALQQALKNPQIVQAVLEQMHKAQQMQWEQQQAQGQGNVISLPARANQAAASLPAQGF